MKKHSRRSSKEEVTRATEIPETFEGQRDAQAKTREVMAAAMAASEEAWKEARKTLGRGQRQQERRTLAGEVARSLALQDFVGVLNEETGASLSSSDLVVRGREKPVFCCAYCGEPIRRKWAARHVQECKRVYHVLEQHNLLDIYRMHVRLPSGKVETVYPDLVEVTRNGVRCVVCGEQVNGPEHFRNDGTVECKALGDYLEQRDMAKSQWRAALRNGQLVYVTKNSLV